MMNNISKPNNIRKKILDDAYKKLISDEYLLRLLYMTPSSPKIEFPLLPEDNLIHEQDMNKPPTPGYTKMWEIIDKHILTTSKSDDLEENRLCRVYIYLGKSRPSPDNMFAAKQEIVVDTFTHHTYDVDHRLDLIIGRVRDLLMYQRITGLGKIDLRTEYDFTAPKEYRAYRSIYEIGRTR